MTRSSLQSPADATHVRAAAPVDDATRIVPRAVPTEGDSATLRAGSVIKSRFVIESVIGRGGMGVVYRAKDLRKEETQDRDPYVALKVLSDQFRRDPTMVIGLQREARKAQTLAHPNITTVFDFDRDGDMVYMTMEVLEGKPLNALIEAHPDGIEKSRALFILRGLCLGLAYAHNKNIIHSDFKPGNVFVTADDRSKILDFGIARAAPVERTEPTSMEGQKPTPTEGSKTTSIGASQTTQFDASALGALTPSYASCEMFEGGEPHPSDDVYALAVVAYQLLSGKHPFDFAPALEARARKLEPRPIKGLKRREWRAIRRGLAFAREDRSADAATFLRDLEGSPRLRLALAASAVLLVGAGGYIGWSEYQRVLTERPDVAFDALPAETQQEFTDSMTFGTQLETFGDAGSALELYLKAYTLHPRNPEAVARIEGLIGSLVEQSHDANEEEIRVFAENVDNVMRTDAYLRNRKALIAAKASLAR
jgi:hypothetical protein